MVFVPCHKSHIDYLVVRYISPPTIGLLCTKRKVHLKLTREGTLTSDSSYSLFRMGIALPHIAAGDNLNLPVLGSMLRSNGAFFIRREWGNDRLYNTIMRDYVEVCKPLTVVFASAWIQYRSIYGGNT
jgi:hypothetical protein